MRYAGKNPFVLLNMVVRCPICAPFRRDPFQAWPSGIGTAALYLAFADVMYDGPQSSPEFGAMESQPGKEAAHRIEFPRWFGTNLSKLWGDVAVNNIENSIIRDSIQRIGQTDPANVQLVAASQLELLARYHQIELAQSRRIFFWALVGSGVGLIFFVAAAVSALPTAIAFFSGVIVEIVAGIVFVLYGKTTAQLSSFQGRLEVLQRYVLANSICEQLDGNDRNKARAALIREISRPQEIPRPQIVNDS
jgi:hypothetical protein